MTMTVRLLLALSVALMVTGCTHRAARNPVAGQCVPACSGLRPACVSGACECTATSCGSLGTCEGGVCKTTCPLDLEYGDVSGTSTLSTGRHYTILEKVPLPSTDGPGDFLRIETYDYAGGLFEGGLKTGVFQLTGDQLKYETCSLCVRLVGEDGAGAAFSYLATGGQVEIVSATSPVQFKLTNVTFQQVDIDIDPNQEYVTRPHASGCTTSIATGTVTSKAGTLCDPLAAVPCDAGQGCYPASGGEFQCGPAGSTAIGQACNVDDDCVAGAECQSSIPGSVAGRCVELCSVTTPDCPALYTCESLDVGMLGACKPCKEEKVCGTVCCGPKEVCQEGACVTSTAPDNDTCGTNGANAIPLTLGVSVSGDLTGAADDYSATAPGAGECGLPPYPHMKDGRDVVYVYTPAADGPFVVELDTPGMFAILWVTSHGCGGKCDAAAEGINFLGVQYEGVKDVPVYVVVDGWDATQFGRFDLRVFTPCDPLAANTCGAGKECLFVAKQYFSCQAKGTAGPGESCASKVCKQGTICDDGTRVCLTLCERAEYQTCPASARCSEHGITETMGTCDPCPIALCGGACCMPTDTCTAGHCTPMPVPTNDTCGVNGANAIELVVDAAPIEGDTTAAHADYGAPGGACRAAAAVGRDVVYVFTPPADGTYAAEIKRVLKTWVPSLWAFDGACGTGCAAMAADYEPMVLQGTKNVPIYLVADSSTNRVDDGFGQFHIGVTTVRKCDPLAPACQAGEGCFFYGHGTNYFACQPAGTSAHGESCAVNQCVAGAQCTDEGICRTLCDTQGSGICNALDACTPVDGTANPRVGVCTACPAAQLCTSACCAANQTCYQGACVPAGDTCTSPMTALVAGTAVEGTTVGLANDVGGAASSAACSASLSAAPGRDIIYSHTPLVTGDFEINVVGAGGFDPAVWVMQGTCSDLNHCIAAADATGTNGAESITIAGVAGVTYYIVVDSSSSSAAGAFTIKVSTACDPLNVNSCGQGMGCYSVNIHDTVWAYRCKPAGTAAAGAYCSNETGVICVPGTDCVTTGLPPANSCKYFCDPAASPTTCVAPAICHSWGDGTGNCW